MHDAVLHQRADDPARAAADVEHAALALDQLGDVLEALALPVALQPDGAVVRAIVVVGGEDRVAQLPQRPEAAQVVGADAERARIRGAGMRRLVVDRHLDDAPAVGVGADEQLLQDVVAARVVVRGQRVAAHQARRARQIGDAEAQPAAEDAIERAAQAAAERRHAHGRAGHEARADEDLALVARRPQPDHRGTGLAQVGVDDEDPLAAGPAQAVDEGDAVAVAGRGLDVGLGPGLPRGRDVGRRGDHDDLGGAGERGERGPQAGGVADLGRDAGRQDDDDREIRRRRGHWQRGTRGGRGASRGAPRHGVALFRFHRASSTAALTVTADRVLVALVSPFRRRGLRERQRQAAGRAEIAEGVDHVAGDAVRPGAAERHGQHAPALRVDAERARPALEGDGEERRRGVPALAFAGRHGFEAGLRALPEQQQRHVRELILGLLAHRRRHRLLALRRDHERLGTGDHHRHLPHRQGQVLPEAIRQHQRLLGLQRELALRRLHRRLAGCDEALDAVERGRPTGP